MTVILDEACFMEQGEEIRKSVEYALITTSKEKGSIWIVSSPSSMASWVYAYVRGMRGKRGEKRYRGVQLPQFSQSQHFRRGTGTPQSDEE